MDYLSCKECEILDKQSKSGLSSDFLDEAYNKAFEGGIITNIEIAKAGGANEKMIAYIREKELLSAVFS